MNEARAKRILDELQKQGVSQMLLTDPMSIYYLTGVSMAPIERFYALLLRADGHHAYFLNHLFPGSRLLMEIADVIEEVPTVCWCGKRAQCNTRYADGKIVREGAQIMLGSNESYVALCRKHFKEGKLREE